jgi:RNA polymerase sigma factor (sigma-70 family)
MTAGWRRRDAELDQRRGELTARARAVLGAKPDASDLSALTQSGIDRLREEWPPPATVTEICALVSDLQQLALELHEHEMANRTRRIAVCERALAGLRGRSSSRDLLDHVCKAAVDGCGFGRVVLGRVEDGHWTPWMFHFTDPRIGDDSDWFSSWIDTRIPLAQLPEAQLLVERRPEVVRDTSALPVHPIIRAGLSTSYVVAPIMPAGSVVGFLHADHRPSARRCDEADRDVLWAFAEGFGHIYERAVLLERLRSQRQQVRDTLGDVESALSDLSESEIELAAQPDVHSHITRTALSVLTTISGSVEELTPRELEVLDLMAAGATNQAIAEELHITEGTVKSHVKQILRKLGAANRSQAIAHYLGVDSTARE